METRLLSQMGLIIDETWFESRRIKGTRDLSSKLQGFRSLRADPSQKKHRGHGRDALYPV